MSSVVAGILGIPVDAISWCRSDDSTLRTLATLVKEVIREYKDVPAFVS